MALSWEDVVNKQFQPTKFREGYDQTEVDDFLDEIVAEFKRLIALNEQLESENAELRAGGAAPAAGPAADTPEAAATPASAEESAPAAAPESADAAATSAAGVLAMAQRLHDEHVAAGEQRSTELVAEADRRPPAVTSNLRAFTVLVRNALFRRVELIARRRWWELGELDGDQGWGAGEWESALADYFTEHAQVQVGANARGPALLIIERLATSWRVRQILDDPEGDHDYSLTAEVDLAASDEAGEAVITITGAGRTAAW